MSPCVRVALLISVFLALFGGDAWAKKKKKGPKAKQHVVALFLVAKDKPNPKIYAAFAKELTKAPASLPGLKLLSGRQLKKRIKTKPDRAITKCGSDIECVAKLGRKAKVVEVAYGRVVPSDSGIKIQFLVVNVAAASIERKVSFDFDSVASVAQVRAQYADLFGQAFAAEPPAMAATEESDDDELSLDMIEGSSLVKSDAATLADSEPVAAESPSAEPAGSDALAAAPPGESEPSAEDIELSPPPTQPAVDVAALAPQEPEAAGAVASAGSPLLFYAGVGLAGIGVAGLGGGAFFGNKAKSLRGDLGSDTTQLEGKDLETDANDAAKRANLLFAAGGAALAVGAGLIVFDLMSTDAEGTTDVSIGTTGTGAFLQWSW